MAIQSDENGFLVGQTVDDIKRANKNTTAILKEVKDIKKLLSGTRSQQNQQRGQGQPPQPPQPDTQPPRPRQSRSNNSDSGNESINNQRVNNRSEQANNQQSNNTNNGQSNNTSGQQSTGNNTGNTGNNNANNSGNSGSASTGDNSRSNTQSNGSTRQETVEPNESSNERLRDANGRFIRNGEQQTAEPNTRRRRNSRGQFSSDNDSDKDTKNDGSLSGLFDGLGDRITTAIDAGNDLQEADPTVKAFQETVEPMAKGYRFVFGSGSAKDKPYFAWLNKIWKTLKNTEANTEEANKLNSSSVLGMLLTAAIVAFGVFSKDGQAFFGKLKEIFVDPVIEKVKEKSGYNTVKKGYDTAVDWTSNNVMSVLVPLIESVFQYWKAVFTNIGTAWDLFIAQVTAKWNIMSTTISEIFKVISVALTGSWDKIVSIGVATFDYFSKSFSSFLKNALSYILDGVAGMLGGLSNFLKDKFGIDISSTVSGITDKAAEMRQSADSALMEAQNSKQVLNDKANALTRPIADQLAIANQKIAETTDIENKKVSEAADRNSKATEETVKAIGNYVDAVGNYSKKLIEVYKGVGSSVVDAVISPASADETPWRGDNPSQVGGNTKEAGIAKTSGSQEDRMKMVYKAFRNADFSDAQAKALTAEAGRENDYNDKFLFGSHIDPAKDENGNNIINTGFFSWNRERRAALIKHMESKGLWKDGQMVRSQEALDEQAKFARKEMESGRWKGLGNFLENKNVDADTAAKQVGKGYIGWAYGQDTIKDNKGGRKPFDWKREDRKRARYQNKLESLVGGGDTATASASVKPEQKTIIATPEQAEKVMPKPQSSVMTAQANAVQPTMPNVTPKQPKIPEQPALVLPMATGAKQAQQPQFLTDIGQNLSDDRLAQIASPYNGFRAK